MKSKNNYVGEATKSFWGEWTKDIHHYEDC